jgi:hypothetical protein
MSTQKERMYQRIEKHGADLNRMFQTKLDNVTLCKKLRSLELKAHRLAEDYCNGVNSVDSENWDSLCKPILDKVNRILNAENADVKIFLNGDARGYALKIKFDNTDARRHEVYCDWGGYGILAPEFNGKA